MFPIPFNFPFRKKDGTVTTMDDAISSGGGSYTLPTASATTKGGVKIGAGLTMDGETLKNTNPTPYTLPTASDETLGGVKVGSGLEIDENGVLSTSGGGGGGISYVDISGNRLINCDNIAANTETHATQIKSPAELVGKTIIGISILTTNGYTNIFALGVEAGIYPITLDKYFHFLVKNNTGNAISITAVRVFYM